MHFLCEDKYLTDLKIKQIVIFITLCLFFSCKSDSVYLAQIAGKQIAVDSSVVPEKQIDSFVLPYYSRINTVLDSTLAFAPKMLSKDDGQYNTSAGNLMADLILEQANPIFKSRTGKEVDFVLFNHGGIRSIISKGKVSARTAYEVMPFENGITVVELNGNSVEELANFLIKSGRAHPISGIQIVIDKNDRLKTIKVQGKPFDKERNYYVATSSYLVTGGDDMGFFKKGVAFTETDYTIRNAMIDYFKKKDTIFAEVDDRYIELK
ncbi:MAG: 5'-nucleotidase C-terminal domain-containing protein [Aurantibacter sp.]